MEVGITGHNFGRGPCKDHSTKVWLQLAQWFLRRRLKCESLRRTTEGRTDRRTPCDGKSSHGLWPGEQTKDIAKVIEKFEVFCIGKTNETFERYTFKICVQQESETNDAYVSKLRKLAKACNYGELEQSLIRDRIVYGIIDNTARKRLLQEDKLTLTKCIDICRALESTCAKLKTMTGAKCAEATDDIKAVRHKSTFYKNKQSKPLGASKHRIARV